MTFAWLGRLREPVRAAFFRVLRQAFATEDGKRLLADTLAGLTQPGESIPCPAPARSIYTDLPGRVAVPRRQPVFITARFRTGSTLLWNLFRHVPGCRAYYEPLNERRWFDPSARGDRTDPTHRGVSDYWYEYQGLDDLAKWYRQEWTTERLYMRAEDHDSGLERYIDRLVQAAPARAVLQFNRVDFRLPWLRHRFPNARIVHLYRHPRDQWCSTLGRLDEFPPEGRTADFQPHDHYYLLRWARDLSYAFPFLDPRTSTHPYALFYYVWRLSHAFGQRYAHISLSYEALCAAPAQELPRLMAVAGIDACDGLALERLVEPAHSGRWRGYASASWFEAHEAQCEAVLSRQGLAVTPEKPSGLDFASGASAADRLPPPVVQERRDIAVEARQVTSALLGLSPPARSGDALSPGDLPG